MWPIYTTFNVTRLLIGFFLVLYTLILDRKPPRGEDKIQRLSELRTQRRGLARTSLGKDKDLSPPFLHPDFPTEAEAHLQKLTLIPHSPKCLERQYSFNTPQNSMFSHTSLRFPPLCARTHTSSLQKPPPTFQPTPNTSSPFLQYRE